jgi:phenylpyruvate tautomerase PptA (4-oxalocrotonate tautomerase family)
VPVYTCTANTETLTNEIKSDLAAQITRIHTEINHVPSTYVNVVFHEVDPHNLYADANPAATLLINGWARRGHPQEQATRLALEISRTASQVSGLPESAIMVVIQSSPARSAVEGGRVLPEPGREPEWIAQHTSD